VLPTHPEVAAGFFECRLDGLIANDKFSDVRRQGFSA
jgi:hypothetical protein